MKHERDIDRLLDLWLIDGPTEVSDRVVLDVADRIEHQPQRPAWRFLRRPTPMTSSARWAAVLVAIALIAVVGFAVFGRMSESSIGGKATPTATSSTDAHDPMAPPLGRYGWWIGAPTALPGFGGNHDRSWLRLSSSASGQYLDVVGSDGATGARTAAVYDPVTFPAPGRLEVRSESSEDGCVTNDLGTYQWHMSPGGTVFSLSGVDDACATRAAVLTGDFVRSDCRNPGIFCLGDLEPGTYRSSWFDPFGTARAAPVTSFGQLGYTLSEGWANNADWPDGFQLMPQPEYRTVGGTDLEGPEHRIYVFRDVGVSKPYEVTGTNCTSAGPASVGTVDEMAAAIAGQPSLSTTAPAAVTIGGYSGKVLDVRLASTWTATCPDVSGPVAAVIQQAGITPGWDLGIGANERWRLVLLDLTGGKTLAILIVDDSNPSRFDEFVAQAMPIVETFELHAPAP